MKNKLIYPAAIILLQAMACGGSGSENSNENNPIENTPTETVGQSGVKDDVSNPNIVQVAVYFSARRTVSVMKSSRSGRSFTSTNNRSPSWACCSTTRASRRKSNASWPGNNRGPNPPAPNGSAVSDAGAATGRLSAKTRRFTCRSTPRGCASAPRPIAMAFPIPGSRTLISRSRIWRRSSRRCNRRAMF